MRDGKRCDLPLQKFIEGQGSVEVFSLVGAAHDVTEEDLFHGVEI